MKLVLKLSFLLVLSSVFQTNAQILNIEKFRLDKDTFNVWMCNVTFGFNAKKQNISTLQYNGQLISTL